MLNVCVCTRGGFHHCVLGMGVWTALPKSVHIHGGERRRRASARRRCAPTLRGPLIARSKMRNIEIYGSVLVYRFSVLVSRLVY